MIKITPVRLKRNETVRRARPFLRDRRIDTYHRLMQRYLVN